MDDCRIVKHWFIPRCYNFLESFVDKQLTLASLVISICVSHFGNGTQEASWGLRLNYTSFGGKYLPLHQTGASSPVSHTLFSPCATSLSILKIEKQIPSRPPFFLCAKDFSCFLPPPMLMASMCLVCVFKVKVLDKHRC